MLNDGSYHYVSTGDFDMYAKLYPAVDLMQEFNKMVGWIDANPKNKKTKVGVKRFINSWLSRAQDSARKKNNTSGGIDWSAL